MNNLSVANPKNEMDSFFLNLSSLSTAVNYQAALELINKGGLNQTYGDINSKFELALAILSPNEDQTEILHEFQSVISHVQKVIAPDRLLFYITKAGDDEICINRSTRNQGVAKIIIHPEKLIALSFITPMKEPSTNNYLEFFNEEENSNTDFEMIIYKFFSF